MSLVGQLTVKQLRDLLKEFEDDLPVVVKIETIWSNGQCRLTSIGRAHAGAALVDTLGVYDFEPCVELRFNG